MEKEHKIESMSVFINELELPLFSSCSFFPFSINENGELALLMRNKKDGKNPELYSDFGTTIKECMVSIYQCWLIGDPNIFYSVARSFI